MGVPIISAKTVCDVHVQIKVLGLSHWGPLCALSEAIKASCQNWWQIQPCYKAACFPLPKRESKVVRYVDLGYSQELF